MKQGIHPDYHQIKVKCSCGAEFETGSTSDHDLQVEICSECHPFYTGKQKLVDTAGRLDKFQKRMAKFEEMKQEAATSKKKSKPAKSEDKKEDKSAEKTVKAEKKATKVKETPEESPKDNPDLFSETSASGESEPEAK